MKASGQLLSGLIRVGAEHTGWHSPYEYLIGWSSIEPDEVILHGLVSDGKFGPHHKTAVGIYLAGLGFKVARWIRATEDGFRPCSVRLSRFARAANNKSQD